MLEARDVPLLPVLAAVVRAGSITAAAAQLGLTKSVVSHHLRALEGRCGGRLLERTTRRLRVTRLGQEVLAASEGVLEAVQALGRVVDRRRDALDGLLRVTAPNDLGTLLAAPAAARLMREHRALRIELVLDDSPRDLVGEGFDVALRLGALRPSSYLVRRLGSTEEIAVATPGLFPSPALVRRPRDLAGASWVVHAELERRRALQLRSASGQVERVATAVQATADSAEAVRALALAGKCCALLPRYLVADDIAAGRLVHVCPAWTGRRVFLQALLPSRHAPPPARAFLAALVEAVHAVGFLREP